MIEFLLVVYLLIGVAFIAGLCRSASDGDEALGIRHR